MQKKYPKEKIKTTALVGEPVVVQLKALNSLRSNSRAFLTLLFSFLSPSSLRSIIRFCETMLSQREAVFYSRLKNAPLCSFSFRPLGLNLSVENASTYRFPVGAKNLSPLCPFRPHFFQAFRSEPIGRKRQPPQKISTSERLHICHKLCKKINQRRILESVPILPAKVKLSVAVGWSEPANGFPTVQEIHNKTYLEGSTSASANPRGRCSTFQVDNL